MPGSRLTLPDRRDIDAGLADGLGYAEIARRLHRPTSTISREVNRNGGHNRYRAEHAERAARQRSRRQRPSRHREAAPAATPPAVGADAHTERCDAIREFERRSCAMLVEQGFPRMMARVLISLHTSDSGERTAAELVEHLHVSPASISKAVRYLERLEFLRRERDLRRRRERYLLADDVWEGVFRRQAQSMAQFSAVVHDGADTLGSATPAGARLGRLSRYLMFQHHETLEAVQRWRRLTASERSASSLASADASRIGSTDLPRGPG